MFVFASAKSRAKEEVVGGAAACSRPRGKWEGGYADDPRRKFENAEGLQIDRNPGGRGVERESEERTAVERKREAPDR